MKENIDYVIADNANCIGKENITDQISGTFIGTNKYFFFVPYKHMRMDLNASGQTITDTFFNYEGQPIDEYLRAQIEVISDVKDLEALILKTLAPEFDAIRIQEINNLNRFKVQASFLASGISMNDSDRKVGWKPFALKFGKKKKDIKLFYKSHLMYVEK